MLFSLRFNYDDIPAVFLGISEGALACDALLCEDVGRERGCRERGFWKGV